MTFEKYLQDKHADQYIGLDDEMPDDFNDWLQDLSVDEYLEYGDKYHNYCQLEPLDEEKVAEQMLSTFGKPKVSVEEIEEIIKEVEWKSNFDMVETKNKTWLSLSGIKKLVQAIATKLNGGE